MRRDFDVNSEKAAIGRNFNINTAKAISRGNI
jgi:hypothetical protein